MRLHALLASLLLTFGAVQDTSVAAEQKKATVKIAITKLLEHPSLGLIQSGILDVLGQNGYTKEQGAKIYLASAAGQIPIAAQIAKRFVGEHPQIIIAITTPSAQAIQKAVRGKDIPMLFAGVTDPVGAHLLKSMAESQGQTTGVSDVVPADRQVQLIQMLQPEAKTIGLLYNLGEQNSLTALASFEKDAVAQGYKVVKVGVSKASEITQAAAKLLKQADALMLFNDNLVISSLEAILKVAHAQDCPVFASDPESVKRGAFAALAFDQYEMGRQAGLMAVKILQGTPVKDVPPQKALRLNVYVNPDLVKAWEIPPKVILETRKKLNDPIGFATKGANS